MHIVAVVLTVILGVVFLAAGSAHARLVEAAVKDLRGHGIADRNIRLIGLAELAGGAGVLIGLAFAPLGIAAASGLVLLMAGAVASHIRWQEVGPQILPAVILGALAVVVLGFRIATV